MGDLSPILPDVTPMAPNAEFPPLELPVYAAASWKRNAIPECLTCPKKDVGGPHRCWQGIVNPLKGIGAVLNPGYTFQQFQQELVDFANGLRERSRRLQRLIQLANAQANGVVSSDYLVGPGGGLPTANVYGGWTYADSGYDGTQGRYYIDLNYVEGSDDPDDITYFATVDDQTAGTKTHAALPWGLLTVSDASRLHIHGGWIVSPATVTFNISVGQTFRLWSDTPIDANVNVKRYGHGGDTITFGLTCGTAFAEPWDQIRDSYPLYAKGGPFSIQITGVTNQPYTILAGRVLVDSHFKAYARSSSPSPWTPWAAGAGFMSVTNAGGAMVSKIDLTTANLTNISDILLIFWKESTDGDSLIVGENRCAFDTPDYGCCWGQSASDPDPLDGGTRTVNHYCAMAESLRDTDYDRAILAGFVPGCYQAGPIGGCKFFTPNIPYYFNPVDAGVLRQLIDDLPWRLNSLVSGAESPYLDHQGCPGMASLVGRYIGPGTSFLIQPTDSADYVRNPAAYTGGWAIGVIYENLLYLQAGFEWQVGRPDGVTPSFDDPSTWPALGPAANAWDKDSEYDLDVPCSSANDPQYDEETTPMTGGSSVSRYDGTIDARHGTSQRFRAGYEFYFPRMPADA